MVILLGFHAGNSPCVSPEYYWGFLMVLQQTVTRLPDRLTDENLLMYKWKGVFLGIVLLGIFVQEYS